MTTQVEKVQVTLTLPDVEAHSLAQLVKRITWGQVRESAEDDDEARVMMLAVVRLQDALAEAGYAPR